MKSTRIAFSRKSLSITEWCYSNITRKALRILHGLEMFYCYCFTKEVCIVTDHKPLVAIISKDLAMLYQCLQCIMLCSYQYGVCIIYKPGPDLYIVEWLSYNNHTENRDQEITGMKVNVHATSTLLNIHQ